MHRSFIITEEERNRILSNHIKATNSQYLNEEMIKGKEFLEYKNNQNVVVDVNNKTLRVANQEEYNQYMNDFQSFGTAGTLFTKMKSQVAQKNPNVDKVQNKKVVTTNTNVQSIQSKLKELGVELGKNANGYLNQQTLNAIYAQLDKIGTNKKTETPTTDNKTSVDNKNTTDTKTPTTDNKVSINTTGNEGGEATSDMS